MKAQAHGASAGPSLTINLPLDAIGPVTVTAPPPALVSRVNAAHVGLKPDALVRLLNDMRGDPRFRDHVIARGKSFRAAPPDTIIAFLRAAPAAGASGERDDDVDHDLLRAAGYASRPGETAPPSASTTRVRRR